MAIEALAGAAVKEIGAEAAREAATKAGLELAQKMASELGSKAAGGDAALKMVSESGAKATGSDIAQKTAAEAGAKNGGAEFAQRMGLEGCHQNSGSELQTAMMERQAVDEGFRIGEMPEEKGEGRELLKQKEVGAADELREKLDVVESQNDADVISGTEVSEIQPGEEENPEQTCSKSNETLETTESLAEKGDDPAPSLELNNSPWERYLTSEKVNGKTVYGTLECGKDNELLNGKLPENSIIDVKNPAGNNLIRLETNGKGRVIELKADHLEKLDGGRDIYQQRRCCAIKEGKAGDDGGHLCASEFGGPTEQFNYAPMNAQINRYGEFRLMEKTIEKVLNSEQTVTDYKIKLAYDGECLRPEKFTVSMKVDGVPKYFSIKNPATAA